MVEKSTHVSLQGTLVSNSNPIESNTYHTAMQLYNKTLNRYDAQKEEYNKMINDYDTYVHNIGGNEFRAGPLKKWQNLSRHILNIFEYQRVDNQCSKRMDEESP